MEEFSDRLKKLIGDRSRLSFARACDVSDGAVKGWLERGQKPSIDKALAIAKQCGVSLEWLISGDGPMFPDTTVCGGSPDFTHVDHYDVRASAGGGAVVESENIRGTIAFRTDWLREEGLDPKRLNVISVMGDSMEPSLADGDIILIDRRESKPRPGGIYVLNYEGNLLVKRLQPLLNGGFKIISDNPRYEPETVQAEQMEQVRIIGRVVWKGGRMS